MTTRTFQQQGQAYGPVPAIITASIDGVQVYSGPVSTLDQPLPSSFDPTTEYGTTLFTWTGNVDFTGNQSLAISVQNSQVLLTQTIANYTSNVSSDFQSFYSTEVDGNIVSDPLSDVQINGVAVSRQSSPYGQWYWIIPPGATFTATVNINAGIE